MNFCYLQTDNSMFHWTQSCKWPEGIVEAEKAGLIGVFLQAREVVWAHFEPISTILSFSPVLKTGESHTSFP